MKWIKLEDGRKLAYSCYGPNLGSPVIFLHGIPGSRFSAPEELELLDTLNIRLIVPDRPGYGFSDFQENRGLFDYASDINQLTTQLGVSSFKILAYSGGGMYGIACGLQLAPRVSKLVLISSPVDFYAEGVTKEMLPPYVDMFKAAAANPDKSLQKAELSMPTPQEMFNVIYEMLSEADKLVISDEPLQQHFIRSLKEVYCQGLKGYVSDLAILAKPWGVTLKNLSIPIDIWHGDCDNNVPVAASEYLSRVIPLSQFYRVSGTGHFLLFTHWRNILKSLDYN